MDYLTTLVTTDTYAKEVKLFGLGPYFIDRFRQLSRVYQDRQRGLVVTRYFAGFVWSSLTTLAGSPNLVGSADGTGSDARFFSPLGVATDSAGNVYVADTGSSTIRKIPPAGVVTTLAGSAGLGGSADGTGSAARFQNPYGVATDNGGNVYIADSYNGTIRKITPAGVVTTLAGLGPGAA